MCFFGFFLGAREGGSRTHEKSITSLNMSQPPLLETTEPAHTNASQTDTHLQTHTAKQKLSVQRAVPAPASHAALGNFQVLTHVFWFNSEITSNQNRSSTWTLKFQLCSHLAEHKLPGMNSCGHVHTNMRANHMSSTGDLS